VAGGKVRQRSEGGEGVADAEEEVAVAEIPEVLSMVVQVPGGAGEGAAAGEFKQDGLNHAVLIVFGLIGQAGDEPVNYERKEKMLVVNVVHAVHGTAVEQETGGDGLESEVFERDAERRLGSRRIAGGGSDKKTGQ